MSKIKAINGWLYKEYYDPIKGYTRRESLKLKATQANKRAAEKRISAEAAIQNYTQDTSHIPDLRSGLKEMLAYTNYRTSTRSLYEGAVTHFIQANGNHPVDHYTKISYVRLKDHFKSCKEVKIKTKNPDNTTTIEIVKRPLAQNSQSIYTRHLHHLFDYFLREKYIKENFILAVDQLEGNPRPIEESDKKRILNYLQEVNPKNYNFVNFLLNTGIRGVTALDLYWKDINWSDNLITFRNIKVKTKAYTFPIIPELRTILEDIGLQKEGRVFPYASKYSLKFFRKALIKLGLDKKYSLHKLKHTFISEMVNKGVSLEDLSDVTDTSIRTLKKYYAKFDKQRIGKKLHEALNNTGFLTRF